MATWNYNLTVDGHTLIFQVTTPDPVGTEAVTATSISGTVDGQPINSLLRPDSYGGNDNSFSTSTNGYYDGLDEGGIAFTYISSSYQTITVRVYAVSSTIYVIGHDENFNTVFDDSATVNSYSEAACFVTGTQLQTPGGAVAVEDLAVGDVLLTAEGRIAPVIWIGHRMVNCAAHPRPNDVMPVRVRAGAFADGVPSRDLWLSPDHAIHAENCLIPVRHLLNGATIVQEQADGITYWRVELDRHDVILAEGLPCESYLDNGGRAAFATGGRVIQLHPDFTPAERCEATGEAAACATLRIEGEAVACVQAQLQRRAAALGYAHPTPTRMVTASATAADLAALLQPDWYLQTNPDVAAAGADARTHYAAWGHREGRLPCPEAALIRALGLIDPATMIRTMPDLVAAGVDPAEYFCAQGWRESRRPSFYFDTGWYRAAHDVPEGMNPLLHYVLLGEQQGLAPSRHFDPAWYRRQYALAPTVCALAHYLQHRRTQDFSPLPAFDVAAYAAAHRGVLRPSRDAYMHFLMSGEEDCRQAA